MGKVISVRINESLEEIIKRYSEDKKIEQSDVIRDLINNGSTYLAIKGYAKGKLFRLDPSNIRICCLFHKIRKGNPR